MAIVVVLTVCLPFAILAQPVDYFSLKKKEAPLETQKQIETRLKDLFSETTIDADGKVSRKLPPAHVMRVLVDPTPESAGKYLEDEEFKIAALQKALAAIESARRNKILAALKGVRITMYSADGCPACEAERELFKEWGIAFEEKINSDVKVFPTIVLARGDKEIARFEGVTIPESLAAKVIGGDK